MTQTYNQIADLKNLTKAYLKARKGKRKKKYVQDFEKNLVDNLRMLHQQLTNETYAPESLKTFIIRDPKTRKISKSAFRDRIIHHAISNVIEPFFDKTFIHDSYANRKRKGALNAIKRFNKFKQKVSKNGTKPCYVLKADIQKYFDTVDRKILIKILNEKIDKKTSNLINKILNNHSGEKGMPLGNLTSQFFANVYLNELDQFVKHKLKAKFYIRYVDDFVILHPQRETLDNYKAEIIKFLKHSLNINLHPQKSRVILLKQGIPFLGFRIFTNHILLQKKNINKFYKKYADMKNEYDTSSVGREKILDKMQGWLAYCKQANTFKYRSRLVQNIAEDFPINTEKNIVSVKKHENLSELNEISKLQYSVQKTLYLFRKNKSIKEIAEIRGIKSATVWSHIQELIKYHKIKLTEVLSKDKISKIFTITRTTKKLKEIKEKLEDNTITYDEIACVLATIEKQQEMTQNVGWFTKTNCFRKCYLNKRQRQICFEKLRMLALTCNLRQTRREFFDFVCQKTTICILPEDKRGRFITWKEFQKFKEATYVKR